MQRLFFALDIDSETKVRIADWRQHAFPPSFAVSKRGREVNPANFHITLAFLGACKPTLLEPLCEAADVLVHSPFSLRLDEVGYWKKSGILWLGSRQLEPKLQALAGDLRNLSRSLHLHSDKKPYTAHLTLARKLDIPPPAPTIAPDFALDLDYFVLMESVSGKRGVSYHELERWPLF